MLKTAQEIENILKNKPENVVELIRVVNFNNRFSWKLPGAKSGDEGLDCHALFSLPEGVTYDDRDFYFGGYACEIISSQNDDYIIIETYAKTPRTIKLKRISNSWYYGFFGSFVVSD